MVSDVYAESSDIVIAKETFQSGLNYYKKDNARGKARVAFLKAAKLNSKFAAPRYNLALIAEEEERWSDAVLWYTAFLKLDKTSAYANVVETKIPILRRYQELDATVEGKKERVFLQYLNQAQDFLEGENAGSALAASELAIESNPKRFEGHLMLAMCFLKAEKHDDAIKKARQALSLASDDHKVEIYHFIKQSEEFKAQQSKIAAADAAFEKKKYDQAATLYAQAWVFSGSRPDLGFSAALSWSLAGDYAKASKVLDRLRKSRNPSVAIHASREKVRIQSLMKNDREKESNEAKDDEDLINIDIYDQALFFLKAKKFYIADAKMTQALDGLVPPSEYAPFFSARGKARQGMSEHYGAIQDFTFALLLNPNAKEYYLFRAKSYALVGDHFNAVRDMDRAIELSSLKKEKKHLRSIKKKYQK